MIFRLSQKLNAKIKAGPLLTLPLDENPLADWSAHDFVADRTQYILLSNTKSLYSMLTFGKGVTNVGQFIERALSSIREFMEYDRQGAAYEHLIAPATGTVRFAKALNRSIIGSMNEMTKYSKYFLAAAGLPLFAISSRFQETPMSALKHGRSAYGFPRDVFAALVKGDRSA